MKILYDHQIFEMQRFGGISNMYVNLIENLPSNISYDIAIKDSENIHLRESKLKKVSSLHSYENFITSKRFKGKRLLYNTIKRYYPSIQSQYKNLKHTIDTLEKGEFDIFHPTFFDDFFLPHLHGKPYILTIYDMISELYFDKNDFQTVKKYKLAKSAAHIIAISKKTKEDIINILNINDTNISVIYLATPEMVQQTTTPIIQGKYILYVGNRDGYKNFLPMVDAITPILQNHREIKLVCTGNPFSDSEAQKFINNNISEQIIHVRPSDIEMRNLYSHALCFIFPSLYEGFGIPILEAWQCGCPVLLNNKSCFPEIAANAAIYFTLDDENNNLTSILLDFLANIESESERIKTIQKERLQLFSWKKSAMELANVYQKVLN